ncbi:polymorphic toxin-type HINT domain-containing protein [Micromonospora sp. WMMC241]|uniref:RHS repeat-associated core domain-containing protein n=1 Tax=Micromonospora sp. WMMC241 TaxID=3015159 RepID=UPI0022B60EA0|nr:RHS repeat-associated core domain-containing protein [Micromonospora sp. WMMC241]MCZ7439198.1 polymorphic toxin-type HINT domain-containing protein [Micromonospora sp. WMMC241]
MGRGARRSLTIGLAALLAATIGGQLPARAERSTPAPHLDPQRYSSAPLHKAVSSKRIPDTDAAAAKVRRPAPVWPAAGSAEVTLGAATTAATSGRAGSLPVTVRPAPASPAGRTASYPGKVRVEVLAKATAEAAGVEGLLVRVGRTDGVRSAGTVEVGVDYAAFATAYGADWASRLRLVRLPECALSTPAAASCRPESVASRNDVRTRTVSAAVPVSASDPVASGARTAAGATVAGGTLFALTSGPSGGAGNFAASSLASTSSWGHGGATGGFQWSYPMRTPPGPGGPEPSIGLGYSSQSVDGRHAATNNQPGLFGEGFDYSPGFIERRYKVCAEDMGGNANNSVKTGDLCWGPENAVMSLNGSTVELLKGSDGTWHPRSENGAKIELLTSAAYANGDDDNEYWKVTTTDGTQYWFGRHRLPGWSTGRPTTNSVLTVPVFGNNPGEPCNAATFAASDCNGKSQAWRWNLDYVQDIHGNTMSYWWAKETNYYAKNLVASTPVVYDRAGYLTRIDYGSDNRDNNEYAAASPYVENTPGRVEFTNVDRCLTNCATKNATTWPDTPWDQNCTATTKPCNNGSPTFWSAKRTTLITTKAWKATASAYQNADSWTFRQAFLDPGDGTRAGLWLDGITHRGLNGGTVTAPEVTFSGIQKQNRVDAAGSDWALAMNWHRVNLITQETGGQIFVTYSDAQCVKGSVMPSTSALDSNKLLCYPVKWTPPGETDKVTDFFHKYVVKEVQQIDPTGGSRPLRTAYDYLNDDNEALWHYDDDTGLTPDDRRSWSQWRGYPKVVTYVGEGAARTKTETLYYRGMYGDKLAGGGTRTTQVQGLEGGAVNDYEQFSGSARETVTWLGGAVLSATVHDMWRSDPPTATRAGSPVAESRYVRVRTSKTRIATDTGWRRSTATTDFDDYGMPTTQEDSSAATAGDERCTKTEYVRNTADWLLTPVKRINGWVGKCSSGPADDKQVLGDVRFSYDSLAYGAAPGKGLLTKTERITSFTGGNRTYQQVGTAKYDARGRMTESTDVAGEKSTTAYVPATGGPVTQQTTTNPLLWTSTVDLDPTTGLVVKSTDTNNNVTEYAYDAMGRATQMWLPNRARVTYPTAPSTTYGYSLSKAAPSYVTTTAVNANGGNDTSYVIYDALGRQRQTQEPANGTGRIMTETFYDAAGRIYKANAAYYDSGAIDTSVIKSRLDQDVPSQTKTLYDTAGRQIHSLLLGTVSSVQVEKARTSTTYHGDHVTVEPPLGQAATTVWTDSEGRTEKLWQYHGRTATGGYDETKYTYHPAGQLATVKDPAGNAWSYTYDIQGRLTSTTDPDTGTSTKHYNNLGQLEKTTDSRPDTPDIWFTYDKIGRPLTTRETSLTGPMRTELTYDSPAKGITKSASRWIGSEEYRSEVVSVDKMYNTTQSKLTLPSSQAGFCGIGAVTCSFTSKASFLTDGSPNTLTIPAAGGLDQEVLNYKYDTTYAMLDRLATDYLDATYYVVDSGYTNLHELSTITRSTALTGAKSVLSKSSYDDSTGRVASSSVTRSTAPAHVANTFYDYDASGNIIKIDDNTGARPRDTQCFAYDHQRRLTDAWTPASFDCAAKPQAESELGGPAPYWQQWSFGAPDHPQGRVGNRLTQTERGTPTGTVTTSYSYPAARAAQPHRLDGWSRTDNTGTTTGSYTYDEAGNMKTRPGKSGQQSLTWDVEGHLASVTDSTGTNSYIYDASGNRLIATDPTGSTLFLGDQEIRKNASNGQVNATRYYSFNGETVAQRTVTGITWLASDHQGTSQVSIANDTNQTITQRRQTPYGTSRGAAVTWPNKQGFVGGYQDPTDLTHLGAREYDPTIGRFISPDPINDPGNPQQLPAYTYAANNPVTFSDPSGEIIPEYLNPSATPGLDLCSDGKTKLSGYACQNLIEGTSGQGQGDTRYDGSGGPRKKSGREKTHEFLEGCGLFLIGLGAGCDGVNAVVYATEGNWRQAALSGVSSVPGVDWACKIRSFCKRAIDWGAGKVTALVARVRWGKAPSINPAAEAAEMAALKKEIRESAKPPAPKTPPPPVKKPDPPAKGKTGGGNSDAPTAKGGCPTHSFAPDTPVLMADGSTEPIADVRVGDQVLAHDPEHGGTSAQTVEKLHVNQDEALTDLVVRDSSGVESTIGTTQHHPFWSVTRKQWVGAGELETDERLLSASASTVSVVEVRNFSGNKVMRDLTVSVIHTYYVLAGNTPVLVHNCGPVKNNQPDGLSIELMEADLAGVSPVAAGTSGFSRATSGSGDFLWTVGEEGGLNMVAAGGGIHHTVASGGAPVMAAGQVSFRNGVVTSFDNLTGHYTPCTSCAAVFIQRGVDAFGKAGVRIPLRVITDYGGKAP